MHSIFTPHSALKPYIQFYRYAEVGQIDRWTPQSLAAAPAPVLVIVTKNDTLSFKEDGEDKTYETMAIVSPRNRFKEVTLKGKVNSLWVVFRHGGLTDLLNLYLKDYVNTCINLTELTGPKVNVYKESLTEQSAPEEIIERVEHYLLDKLRLHKPKNDTERLRHALEQLEGQCYKKNIISAVCRQTGYSIKSFERHTLQMTGICPKQFQRIARFNLTLTSILEKTKINWAQTAYEFGYSDQTHFIKEFKSFYGRTPGALSTHDGVMKHLFRSHTARR